MADVVSLDPPRWTGKLEQLGQVFRSQEVLLTGAAGSLQLVAGIALHQVDQIGLLGTLRHRQLHLATPQLREPLLDQALLGQRHLQQQLRRDLHRLDLAVVLLNHGLKNAAEGRCTLRFRRQLTAGTFLCGWHTDRIGGEAEPPNELAGTHLEQLHRCHPFIRREGQHVAAHRAIADAHLLIGCERVDPLQLIAYPSGTFEIEALGVALHLLLQQLQQLLVTPLEHHRHLTQRVVIVVRADLFLAHTGAAADVEVQTGAVFMQRLRALTQWKDPFHQPQGAAQ